MQGLNEPASPYWVDDAAPDVVRNGKALRIHRCQRSLIRSGPLVGQRAFIVGMSNCNMRCRFCDVEFLDVGELRDIDELMLSIKRAQQHVHGEPIKHVVLTGGEPFLQNILPFVRMLNGNGYTVQVRTNGFVAPEGLIQCFPQHTRLDPIRKNSIVCSPKYAVVDDDLLPYVSAWLYPVETGCEWTERGFPILATQHADVAQLPQVYEPPEKHSAPIWLHPIFVYTKSGKISVAKTRPNVQAAHDAAQLYGYNLSPMALAFLDA